MFKQEFKSIYAFQTKNWLSSCLCYLKINLKQLLPIFTLRALRANYKYKVQKDHLHYAVRKEPPNQGKTKQIIFNEVFEQKTLQEVFMNSLNEIYKKKKYIKPVINYFVQKFMAFVFKRISDYIFGEGQSQQQKRLEQEVQAEWSGLQSGKKNGQVIYIQYNYDFKGKLKDLRQYQLEQMEKHRILHESIFGKQDS